jgi:diketogulonate reductase-like aldo/keto reductase
MKVSLEYAFVARELIGRTGRHLVVLTLPLLCWLAGQECPAQALLAWAVQRALASLTTRRTSADARENFDVSALPGDALAGVNRIQSRRRLNLAVTTGVPDLIPQES